MGNPVSNEFRQERLVEFRIPFSNSLICRKPSFRAGAFAGDADALGGGFALVGVGFLVTAADGIEYIIAAIRNDFADTQLIGRATASIGEVAEFTFVTLQSLQSAAFANHDVAALALAGDADSGRVGLACVAIRLIVATANRRKNFRAVVRNVFADAGLVGRAAQGVLGKIAELTIVTFQTQQSSACLAIAVAALAVVIDVYTFAVGVAVIAVSFAVAAAHGSVLQRAGVGDHRAYADGQFVAASGAYLAERIDRAIFGFGCRRAGRADDPASAQAGQNNSNNRDRAPLP
jgi:hypothetical protein